MDAIRIHERDNVAVALKDLQKGEILEVAGQSIVLQDNIPNGHKVALAPIAIGETAIKYGNPIGIATAAIAVGNHVHDHNLKSGADDRRTYTYNFQSEGTVLHGHSDKTFQGYLRKNGTAGIRNYLLILPTVFCANGPMDRLAQMVSAKYPACENFDGVLALHQEFGCSQAEDDLRLTAETMASFMANGNFGGILILSLGCEVNDLVNLKQYIGDEVDPERVRYMVLQDTDNEFTEGMKLCDELMEKIKRDRREAINMEKLHICFNCGGSDGFSGITANKLLGKVCNRLVAEGATTSITEVAEMIGGEHILMNRAINEQVYQDIVDLIYRNLDFYGKFGLKMNENPTQGNKAGGLTTIEDKSLGCIQKGGDCAIYEVVKFGKRATQKGFILVEGPGNDLTGVTAQIAAGAVLTIFTTGRGTPAGFGGPLYRLTSNSRIANKKPMWTDYNCGPMLETDDPEVLQKMEADLYDGIMATVNGEYRTRNEINGYYLYGTFRTGPNM